MPLHADNFGEGVLGIKLRPSSLTISALIQVMFLCEGLFKV